MIEIFQGRIGGGKTYHAVLRIAEHLSKGGHVFTNIQINPEGMVKLCQKRWKKTPNLDLQFHYLEEEKIPNFHKNLQAGSPDMPVLAVIDEAQLFFNSRSWAKMDQGIITFQTQSRKVRVDLILITQNMSLIDKQLRVNAQFVWAFKDFRRFLSWCPLPLILAVRFDIDAKTLISQHWTLKDPAVFKAYDSFALLRPIDFGSGTPLERVVLDGQRPSKTPLPFRFRRTLYRLLPIVGGAGLLIVLVFLVRLGWFVWDFATF